MPTLFWSLSFHFLLKLIHLFLFSFHIRKDSGLILAVFGPRAKHSIRSFKDISVHSFLSLKETTQYKSRRRCVMMHADIYPSMAYPQPARLLFLVVQESICTVSVLEFSFRPCCASHCLWFIHYSIFFKFFTAYVLFSHCSLVKRELTLSSLSAPPIRVPQISSLYLYLVFEQQLQVWIAHLALIILTACHPVIFFYSTFWASLSLSRFGGGGRWIMERAGTSQHIIGSLSMVGGEKRNTQAYSLHHTLTFSLFIR